MNRFALSILILVVLSAPAGAEPAQEWSSSTLDPQPIPEERLRHRAERGR